MDRNTLVAVILSTIVLAIGFYLQTALFAPEEPLEAAETAENLPAETETSADDPSQDTNQQNADEAEDPDFGDETSTGSEISGEGFNLNGREFIALVEDDREPVERTVEYVQEDFIRIVMDTRGGNISEVYLLSHEDQGEPLEFFFGEARHKGLNLRLGGIDGPVLDPVFYFRQGSADNSYEFYRQIIVPGQEDAPFEIIKRYTFLPDEYMFEMEVELRNSVNRIVPLDYNGTSYTLSIGPQIGPEFQTLSNTSRTDFRKYSYLDGEKRKDIRNISDGERRNLDTYSPWAAVNGKYFVAVAVPGNTGSDIVFGAEPTDDGIQGSQLHLLRPAVESSRVTDTFRFYFGPKSTDVLRSYQNADDNGFGIRELNIDVLMESSWIGWLEKILKGIMNFFYGLIPNWGVSIILLTILVKVLLYPLTRKSYESTAKMKELSPKIAAIKEKYPDDQQKQNQATMELYQKEKVNPLGGCLPILLQFPFFIAMFSLFNNHFDLRGATFIPGWITDLSSPEAILSFGFSIPLLNWDALRLLPLIFLGTQLLSVKFTQPADTGQSSGQMKMMTMGMPIMFFFIMYNMPSGLLVYWIFQNIITTGQQFAYNYFTHKKNTRKA
ncbi:membrane protein insertase YidC [Salinispira pacifica]|uniref:Membrane protein insertase YidC n=1 Tax=Salinispira pacifica TaxID=1307761 RepID=V5WCD9_9SPIO|nr:membrane protein insertase YidC [Salinispira pacifica]AHC13453.1 Inner membrane protein translocase component YidC, long form [Salinispira pacifica]